MPILSDKPTTRRGYLSRTELQQYADITITDTNEADDVIGQAEEIIDAYVGHQVKFMREVVTGRCETAGGNNTLILETDQKNVFQDDYFKGCEIEIIGGTGEGQRRRITVSDYESGQITVADNWTTNPDNTTFYRIYQLGKFPRHQDVHYFSDREPHTYYKSIPEAIKRAVAAQVAYIVEMGDSYFNSDKADRSSERIGDYSYENGAGGSGLHKLIAPKAKLLLRGIKNRVGVIV